MMITLLSACLGLTVETQHLRIAVDPESHTVACTSTIDARGPGTLVLALSERVKVDAVRLDDRAVDFRHAPAGDGTARIEIELPDAAATVELTGRGRFTEDVASGERPGQIHNFAVQAHVGTDGVFLSDGSSWHPRPLDADGRPALHRMSVRIEPVPGWAFVASGDPVGDGDVDKPFWHWETPRPVDGLAVVGNRHEVHGVVHETEHGPVEIVMHAPEEHRDFARMHLEAAASYLDLYVPKLGPFPYRRFSIVENFFSSGFAFPGFTVLGPRVVAMAPRSLVPGYLDHELLHNWWGNGVYVDPADGNWCEALTSYCANYWRRVAEDGPDAGRDFRRGILMKLSTDPDTLDDGPLGRFGSADPSTPGPDRFVGYDKGAFMFYMLGERVVGETGGVDESGDGPMWASLRRFAESGLGRRASWSDIQAAFEASSPRAAGWLDGFFDFWVRGHPVPRTVTESTGGPVTGFIAQLPATTGQTVDVTYDADGRGCEIDPRFRMYRVLPPAQLVPTIAGTTGPGGLVVESGERRPEVTSYLPQLGASDDGENLVLIGRAAIETRASLIARSADPIVVNDDAFTIGGKTFDGDTNAVLHTMPHPDRPGRFITVFHSNGDAGWSRLRLIRFYSRDSTIVWDGKRVIERRVFEPSRRLEA